MSELTFHDKLKNRYYYVKYPEIIKVVFCDNCLDGHELHKCPNYCPVCGFKLSDERELANTKNNTVLSEYKEAQKRLDEEFKNDALSDVGLENHPKKDKIFSWAESKGHSGGVHEIYNCLSDISELFND